MPNPFSIRPSMPSPAPRPGMPVGPTPKWSVKPAPKPVIRPTTKPGILGGHGFSSFLQMRGFARKQAYAPAPTYGTRLGKEKRVEVVKTLQKYSGQAYGLSTEKYHETLNKMRKEKYLAGVKRNYKKAKELDQQIKQLAAWERAKK